MNSASVFASHKGPTCILIAFVHISFGLYFKKMLVFVLYIVKQVDTFVHLNINLIKIDQMKFLNLISYQQVF